MVIPGPINVTRAPIDGNGRRINPGPQRPMRLAVGFEAEIQEPFIAPFA